jgi:hypothetical protein
LAGNGRRGKIGRGPQFASNTRYLGIRVRDRDSRFLWRKKLLRRKRSKLNEGQGDTERFK